MQSGTRIRALFATLLTLCLALAACGDAPKELSSSELLGLANSIELKNATSPEAGLLCAGMPTEAQFEELVDEGLVNFLSLRVPGEEGTGWEGDLAKSHGVHFENLPIDKTTGVNEESARAFAAKMKELSGPKLVYCGSSNRVGALFALAAFHVDGATPEQALEAGKRAGLTKLEPRVREQLGLPALEAPE